MWLLIAAVLVWCGATVKLGKRTFFQHVSAVWSTPEAQDMKDGIEQKAGPVLDKVERGVKAGYHEATRGDGGTEGSGSGSSSVPSPQSATGTR
jgi:hypothetical protein